MNKAKIRKMTTVAILASMSTLLMFIEIPLGFTPPFYKIDFSEIPVLIGAFAFGPLAGVAIELVKNIIHFFIRGMETLGVGEIANFSVGVMLVVPASLIYYRHKTRKTAIIGLVVGVALMTLASSVLNAYFLLPVYAKLFEMNVSDLVAMGTAVNPNITNLTGFIMLAVVPFNLIKGVAVSIVVILIYKRVSFLIKGKDHLEVDE